MKFEDKFLVLKRDYLNGETIEEASQIFEAVKLLSKIQKRNRKKANKNTNPKYYVINRDEKYSPIIAQLIKLHN